jgi:hypothetical protein
MADDADWNQVQIDLETSESSKDVVCTASCSLDCALDYGKKGGAHT